MQLNTYKDKHKKEAGSMNWIRRDSMDWKLSLHQVERRAILSLKRNNKTMIFVRDLPKKLTCSQCFRVTISNYTFQNTLTQNKLGRTSNILEAPVNQSVHNKLNL